MGEPTGLAAEQLVALDRIAAVVTVAIADGNRITTTIEHVDDSAPIEADHREAKDRSDRYLCPSTDRSYCN